MDQGCYTVKVVTKDYGYENTWKLGSCNFETNDYDYYQDHETYELTREECCLTPGQYELVCKCSYGDGWHGGYLEIAGKKYCEQFNDGTEKKETVTLAGGNYTFCIRHSHFNYTKLRSGFHD